MRKILRKIRYAWRVLLPRRRIAPLDTSLDVVIPVCEKDLHILPLCLEGVRRNVAHRIEAVYIVAAENPRIREFCRRHGLEFVEESGVMGYGPASLGVSVGRPPCDRSGWIFQQLLKLSGRIGRCEHFLVIDSDHILLRPHTFVAADGRLVFYGSIQYHDAYYRNIERIMGFRPRSGLSYVAHKMIFSRAELARLRERIESRSGGERWDRAIVASLDREEVSGFSEFELFGNFVPAGRKRIEPWRHKSLRYDRYADYATLHARYARRHDAITFPDYRSRGMAVPQAADMESGASVGQ